MISKIKDRFLKLPLFEKMVSLGALLTVVSVFLPWYEDIDAFKTGDMFLGITGPLYLAGFVILLGSTFSLLMTFYKLIDKKLPALPMSASQLNVTTAGVNLFLLILAGSVYFHDKFGVNIALKEARFGMIMAFIGSTILGISALLSERMSSKPFTATEGKIEPLIDLNNYTERKQRDIHDPKEVPINDHKEKIHHHVTNTLNKAEDNAKSQPWRMDL